MMNDGSSRGRGVQVSRILPPNALKKKVGSGGLDEACLAKAEATLNNNTINFVPLAVKWLNRLDDALQELKSGKDRGEEAVETLLYPVIKLKEQGGLFSFPLVTEISEILIGLLETRKDVDDDLLDVIEGHRMAIAAVIRHELKGDGGQMGKQLTRALMDAMTRYHNLNRA